MDHKGAVGADGGKRLIQKKRAAGLSIVNSVEAQQAWAEFKSLRNKIKN